MADNLSNLRANHVALRVVDYDAAVAWYTEKLGFKVMTEWAQEGSPELHLAYLDLKGFKVEIIAGGDPTPLEVVQLQERPSETSGVRASLSMCGQYGGSDS